MKHVSWGSTESTSVSCTCCLWSGKQEATAPLSFIPSVQRTRLSVSSWQTGFKADSALHRSVISSLLSTLSWHIEASHSSPFPQESSSCLLTWILSSCSSRALHPSRTPSLSSMGFKTVWPFNSCPSSLEAETTAILNPYIGLFGEDLAKSCKDNSPSVLTTSWERSPIGDSAPTPSSRSVKIMSRLSRLLLISWISSLIPSKFLRAREYFRFAFWRLSWVNSTCRLCSWTKKKSMSKPEKTYRIRRFPKGCIILEMMVTTCGLFRVLFVSVLGIKHQYCDFISLLASPPFRDIYQPASVKTYSASRGFSLSWLLALTESFAWLVCRIVDFSRGVNKLTRRQKNHANDSVNAKSHAPEKPLLAGF